MRGVQFRLQLLHPLVHGHCPSVFLDHSEATVLTLWICAPPCVVAYQCLLLCHSDRHAAYLPDKSLQATASRYCLCTYYYRRPPRCLHPPPFPVSSSIAYSKFPFLHHFRFNSHHRRRQPQPFPHVCPSIVFPPQCIHQHREAHLFPLSWHSPTHKICAFPTPSPGTCPNRPCTWEPGDRPRCVFPFTH